MRISDWSSDVCSSDLAVAQQQVAAVILHDLLHNCQSKSSAALARRHVGLGQAAAVDFRQAPAVVGDLDDAGAAVGAEDQLGRASCRERVCQYVLISVVAVSLKKKKTILRKD